MVNRSDEDDTGDADGDATDGVLHYGRRQGGLGPTAAAGPAGLSISRAVGPGNGRLVWSRYTSIVGDCLSI